MGMPSRMSIYQQVAQRLEADLPSFQGNRLPPMKELCHKYDVSSKTMVKAAAVLRGEGLLWYGEGKAMRIVGRSVAAKPERGTAVPLVCRDIKEKIQRGHFKAGQLLPKATYFVSECGVSRNSVGAALYLLAGQGLVHRRGGKWFAGPPRKPAFESAGLIFRAHERPAIVLIIPDYITYRVHFNSRARDLFTYLRSELNESGIELLIALQTHSAASAAFPSGLGETRALVKQLGGRYMGCFLSLGQDVSDNAEWVQTFASFNKPVAVHLDQPHIDEGPPPRLPSHCFRVYINLAEAPKIAVGILHQLGHRRIAILQDSIIRNNYWMQSRRAIIEREAQRLGDGAEVETVTMPLPKETPRNPLVEPSEIHGDTMFNYIESLQSALKRECLDDAKTRETIRHRLVKDMPSMESFVKAGRYTAIIAGNDSVAANCYLWLCYTGRKVPADFSMISFDNHPTYSLLRFSTFDWRRDNLGYLAAHKLIGDIPVRLDANGNLATPPGLVDRGSLAPPLLRKRHAT